MKSIKSGMAVVVLVCPTFSAGSFSASASSVVSPSSSLKPVVHSGFESSGKGSFKWDLYGLCKGPIWGLRIGVAGLISGVLWFRVCCLSYGVLGFRVQCLVFRLGVWAYVYQDLYSTLDGNPVVQWRASRVQYRGYQVGGYR